MPSIVTVFKATIDLLVNKGRDVAVEKFKHGDIVDQQVGRLIVRELHAIKSKLDASARKDLKASVSFFQEGIVFMYQLFDQTSSSKSRSSTNTIANRPGATSARFKIIDWWTKRINEHSRSFVKELETDVNLTDLDESAKRTLANAKKRFDNARVEATRAFSNESLEMSDRILATKVRVMATLLHEVDNPASVLAVCKESLKELHVIPTVQRTFSNQVSQGFTFGSFFYKDKVGELIADVCHVNRVIYNVTHIVGKEGGELFDWPSINIGHQTDVDPLRDHRVAKLLRELKVEHYCLVFSFGKDDEKRETSGEVSDRSESRGEWGGEKGKGTLSSVLRSWLVSRAVSLSQLRSFLPSRLSGMPSYAGFKEREKEHRLTRPWDIATNTESQFFVADKSSTSTGGNVKVFNINGKFLYSLSPPYDDADKKLRFSPLSVATDREYVYVLADPERGHTVERQSMYVFDQPPKAKLNGKFPLRKGSRGLRVTVSDHQVAVLVIRDNAYQMEVYETDGRFVRSFGEGIIKNARDITAGNDGQVMVLDVGSRCVHVFSAQGDHLRKFTVQDRNNGNGRITFHKASEYVILSSQNPDAGSRGQVSIYLNNSKLLRSIQLGTEEDPLLTGVAVTVDGRIAVTSYWEGKLYIT